MLLLTPRVTGGEEARPARSATSVVTGSATSVVTNSATSVVIDSAICVDRGTVTFVVNSTDEFVGFNANRAEQSRALRVTQVPPPMAFSTALIWGSRTFPSAPLVGHVGLHELRFGGFSSKTEHRFV